jgi:Asp/Glu/hydantoin racemase
MPVRILVVNPNITEAVTAAMTDEARRHASADTRIVSTTAAFGTQYVATRPEAAIAGHAVLDAVASFTEPVDAVIVAAFGDPGLAAAKELFDVPVVGITEAALLTAWALGRRIAIVCMSPRLATWYRECAEEHGLAARVVAVRSLPAAPGDLSRAREQARDAMATLCREAVSTDGAEVVIVGGGPLAGLARDLAPGADVPLLDGVACAVCLAESLVRLAPRPPASGSFARPPGKPSRGLSPALANRIEDPD